MSIEETVKRYNAKAKMVSVIASHMDGKLSEGQACKILGLQPIDLREMEADYNAVAEWLWKRYRDTGLTIDFDFATEAQRFQRNDD